MALEELGSRKGGRSFLIKHWRDLNCRLRQPGEILFSGCCLDNGSQPWDHLGGGEEAEEEVDP